MGAWLGRLEDGNRLGINKLINKGGEASKLGRLFKRYWRRADQGEWIKDELRCHDVQNSQDERSFSGINNRNLSESHIRVDVTLGTEKDFGFTGMEKTGYGG